jgi:hypothetical protein
MNSATTRSFREQFAKLPEAVQRQARKQFRLWTGNPHHPSLHFKKVNEYWSVRINDDFRAVARLHEGTYYWFLIVPHRRYEREINN